MQQHNPFSFHLLAQPKRNQKRGYVLVFGALLALGLCGTALFWPGGLAQSLLETSQTKTIHTLIEQNRQLTADLERLQKATSNTESPATPGFHDLVQRIYAIEQHQNALIEAIKGPQQPKMKRSSLEEFDKSRTSELAMHDLLNDRLGLIEKEHMELANSLTERSQKNARVLSLMLNSVSDRLVPQRLFGSTPTNNKSAMGGPYLSTRLSPTGLASLGPSDPEFHDVVSHAIDSMNHHARLYSTLINLPLARPLSGEAQYVSGFGNRSDPFTRQPAFHAGIDLRQSAGSAVLATGHGIVVHAGPAEGYGNMVEIAHTDGVSTRYGHLNRISVSVGETVVTGQKLGTLGSTGRSTGPHLHYETRIRDQAVNPIPFLQMGEQLKRFDLIKTATR